MNKGLIETFLVLVISILCYSSAFGQEDQEIPSDFFMGKWGGNISGAVVDTNRTEYPFSMELVGHSAESGIGPLGGGAEAWMKMDATWPGITLVDTSVACLFAYGPDYPFFTILYPVSDPATLVEIGYNTAFYDAGFTVQIENENLIRLVSGGVDEDLWEDDYASGELHRIYVRQDTLEKTVNINEPIITDTFTQRDIIVPNIGEVIVDTNSECEFKADTLLEQWKGKIYHRVRQMEPHQLEMRSPVAALAVRGTEFVTSVDTDGTTTLTVLEGTVEFSDLNRETTVTVEENQMSVVNPEGLPSEPVSIDPNQIPRWWE